MNEQEVIDNQGVGDDGLTDEERKVLQTPVAHVAPEQRHILVALRDKKDKFISDENTRLRAADKHREEEKNKAEIAADQARHAKLDAEKK